MEHSLIAAVALVALDGLKDLLIQDYRHHSHNGDWNDHPAIQQVAIVRHMIERNQAWDYHSREIEACLAKARQTARIDLDKWETIVKVKNIAS